MDEQEKDRMELLATEVHQQHQKIIALTREIAYHKRRSKMFEELSKVAWMRMSEVPGPGYYVMHQSTGEGQIVWCVGPVAGSEARVFGPIPSAEEEVMEPEPAEVAEESVVALEDAEGQNPSP